MAKEVGTLTTAGRVVARLSGWSGRLTGGGCDIRAFVSESNEYWLTHAGALTLRLSMGRKEAVIHNVTITAMGPGQYQIVGDSNG